MIIKELYVKQFGKISEEHFYFRDGVQVIQGENEFGKSTLHSFIRAMLFGLERGRGRAAAKDDYTRFEPWAGGAYAGVMRFECGGRTFRLERNFKKYEKKDRLICEDDGEELSLEHGDLEMLHGGMSRELFDSTISVGQLKGKPGQALSDALENFAVNYYRTGGGEFDYANALENLKERRKEIGRQIKAEEEKQEKERSDLQLQCHFLEEEMDKLQGKFKNEEKNARSLRVGLNSKREQLRVLENQKKSLNDEKDEMEYAHVGSWKSFLYTGIGGLLVGGVGLLWSWLISGRETISFAGPFAMIAGILFLIGIISLGGAFIVRGKNVNTRVGKQETQKPQVREEDSAYVQEAMRADEEELNRTLWYMGQLQEEWKEKEISCSNLRDRECEIEQTNRYRSLNNQKRALMLAEEMLAEAAQETGRKMSSVVDQRASEIFAEITDGKYQSISVGEQMTVWDGEHRISVERLSRGTLEQIYFAVRMAAADLLLQEPMPLIFDDAFAFYDDKRLRSVIKWLSRQKKQVIIFSCHNREKEMF